MPTNDLQEANRRFYDALWSDARLIHPERFNTWPLVSGLLAGHARRLEVAPGLRPRLPIADTQFLDISAPALQRLKEHGGQIALGEISSLPFADHSFDLVCALDIVEHVDDDARAWSELCRVATSGATILLAVPLHASRWNAFDDFVGHRRRYEPAELTARLTENGLRVAQSAIYGMQPRASWVLNVGIWFMTHRRRRAMRIYNHILMPLALRMEKPLVLAEGLIDLQGVDEVLLVCEKG